MTIPTDERLYSTDAISASFTPECDGITTDGSGGVEVTWDEVPTVSASTIGSEYTKFFDVDTFYRLETTIARPIEQPYVIDGKQYTFQKVADELRESAWSFDNRPFTLGHPDQKVVTDVREIHGFWHDTHYDDDVDGLQSALHVPQDDRETLTFVEDNGDVSIGFFNNLKPTPDRDGIDAIQVDMYGNHVAAVERGRCPPDRGCGFNADGADGGEHGHAIPQSSMHDAADDLGGGVPRSQMDENVTDDNLNSNNMSDGDSGGDGCSCGGDGVSIDVTDMTVDALRSKHDSLDEQFAEYEQSIDEVDALDEEIDELESHIGEIEETVDEYVVDADEPIEAVEILVDEVEELREFRQDKRDERTSVMVDELSDVTEYSEDELEEMDLDELETVEEVAEKAGASISTPDTTTDSDSDSTDELDETALYNTQY